MSHFRQQLGILGQGLSIIVKGLGLFMAAIAPLMFLVGVIAGMDRWGTHNRFLNNLEEHGKVARAIVSYVDDENGRAGVDFLDAEGKQRYGTLELRFYSPQVRQDIRPGIQLDVIYIDALISEYEKTALLEHYADVKQAPAITPDVWWVLGISWLLIAIWPHFTFLGMVNFDQMLLPLVEKPK